MINAKQITAARVVIALGLLAGFHPAQAASSPTSKNGASTGCAKEDCVDGCSATYALESDRHAATQKIELGDSPRRGPDDARVTVVVFSDFECPYCTQAKTIAEQLIESYEDDVAVVFKHNPLDFHDQAFSAAMASEAARAQGRFWQMHDLLFENQTQLSSENYLNWAQKIGLDLEKFAVDMKSSELEARISADQSLARKLGTRGTPAFLINGRHVAGAQPIERFHKIIRDTLAQVP